VLAAATIAPLADIWFCVALPWPDPQMLVISGTMPVPVFVFVASAAFLQGRTNSHLTRSLAVVLAAFVLTAVGYLLAYVNFVHYFEDSDHQPDRWNRVVVGWRYSHDARNYQQMREEQGMPPLDQAGLFEKFNDRPELVFEATSLALARAILLLLWYTLAVEASLAVAVILRIDKGHRETHLRSENDAVVESAVREAEITGLLDWAGELDTTLTIVFTDVVGSTALGEKLGNQEMNKVRSAHFDQGRKLLLNHGGREIKTIGDSFMIAFRSVNKALDFVLDLCREPGHPSVTIRAGLHIGQVRVEEGDLFGGSVNYAARVVGAIKGAEIWLSDRAKRDLDEQRAREHEHLKWTARDGVEMKGFGGKHTLWALENPPHREAL
jgi:class 3 adenylate cyclase